MTMTSRCEAILSWFKGKAQENAGVALGLLIDSEKQGFWLKGASRKVKAALTKANVADKWARSARAWYDLLAHDRGDYGTVAYEQMKIERDAWFKIYMGLHHGSRVCDVLTACTTLRGMKLDSGKDVIVSKAWTFACDMMPAIELMALLDSRRPARVVVFKTLSATVLTTFANLGMTGMDLTTVREPEIRWEWVDQIAKDGTKFQVRVGTIVWPAGTRFNCSKFSMGSKTGNRQCHACGHAIKNPYNWVPVLVDDTAGVPHALFIGKDCAHNLFDADVEGDAMYQEASAS